MEIINSFNIETDEFSELNLNIVHLYNLIHPDLEMKKLYQEKESEWNAKVKRGNDNENDNGDDNGESISRLTNDFRMNIKGSIDWDCLDFCDDPIQRKNAWLAKNSRGNPDNILVTKSLLRYCQDQAEKRGFKSWAHYQADSLGGLDFVKRRLKQYCEKIKPSYNSLMMRLEELNGRDVKPWDVSYLLNKYKKIRGDDGSWVAKALQPALFQIFTVWKAMGINIELVDEELAGVKLIGVEVSLNNEKIGTILLDCYSHEGKYHRGLSTVVLPRNKDGNAVSYSTVIIENTEKLTKREFVTLVTELAHSLHFILSKVPITTHFGLEVPVNHMLHHLDLTDDLLSVIQQIEDIRISEYCIELFETGEIKKVEENWDNY